MAGRTGSNIGQYQLHSPLGRGGMAVVYRAYQPAMERYVAVKVIATDQNSDPSFLRRFRQEAPMQRQHSSAGSAAKSLRIEDRLVSSLKGYSGNARTHSRKQLHQLAASIHEFGFNNPILIDPDNTIIAGHGRWEAAKLLALKTVPTIQLGHLTAAQKRAFAIADNRLAELAEWDFEVLGEELSFLFSADEEVTFDPRMVGFDTPEGVIGES